MTEAKLAKAEALLSKSHAKLTPLRRKVLELLLETPTPSKAYDLLDQLNGIGAVNPPTIYRTLNFLMKHKLIHRIQSLNAYVACCLETGHQGAAFMICEICNHVSETHAPEIIDSLEALSTSNDFTFRRAVIEVQGLCAKCAKS